MMQLLQDRSMLSEIGYLALASFVSISLAAKILLLVLQ